MLTLNMINTVTVFVFFNRKMFVLRGLQLLLVTCKLVNNRPTCGHLVIKSVGKCGLMMINEVIKKNQFYRNYCGNTGCTHTTRNMSSFIRLPKAQTELSDCIGLYVLQLIQCTGERLSFPKKYPQVLVV